MAEQLGQGRDISDCMVGMDTPLRLKSNGARKHVGERAICASAGTVRDRLPVSARLSSPGPTQAARALRAAQDASGS